MPRGLGLSRNGHQCFLCLVIHARLRLTPGFENVRSLATGVSKALPRILFHPFHPGDGHRSWARMTYMNTSETMGWTWTPSWSSL